ncbi:MAG: hypothetical protein HOF10_03750 [Chloroflexi bacterium]|nr:hypothetical protein [Chloroflexota bacterium]
MSMVNINERKIVYLGMNGSFSVIPFKRLIEAGANIRAVIMPRENADDFGPSWLPNAKPFFSELPMLEKPKERNLHLLASENQIPVLSVGSLKDEETFLEFKNLSPDIVFTVCFPRKIPKKWLEISNLGFLNLHPSLLPKYRGPAPLFWQFRAGEENMGVTLHFMDEEMDTGYIIAQKKVNFANGVTAAEADEITATVGGAMMVEMLSKEEFPRVPQNDEEATGQKLPDEDAKIISTKWDVKRAYDCLKGADEWAPFWLDLGGGEKIKINQAFDIQIDQIQSELIIEEGGIYSVQMQGGIIRFR